MIEDWSLETGGGVKMTENEGKTKLSRWPGCLDREGSLSLTLILTLDNE